MDYNDLCDFYAGTSLGGKLRLEDETGNLISEEDLDPEPFAVLYSEKVLEFRRIDANPPTMPSSSSGLIFFE